MFGSFGFYRYMPNKIKVILKTNVKITSRFACFIATKTDIDHC